ncbi:MAG: hypothetical protein N3A57_06140 [Negativicutes bacterium]|nr:hypothetical protein [Negativicutes bacterium]
MTVYNSGGEICVRGVIRMIPEVADDRSKYFSGVPSPVYNINITNSRTLKQDREIDLVQGVRQYIRINREKYEEFLQSLQEKERNEKTVRQEQEDRGRGLRVEGDDRTVEGKQADYRNVPNSVDRSQQAAAVAEYSKQKELNRDTGKINNLADVAYGVAGVWRVDVAA